MDADFVKFPRTPHLFWLGTASPRGDKILSHDEGRVLLHRRVTVEEKLDGSSLGFSVDSSGRVRAQSRGRYIEKGSRAAVGPLWGWLAGHEERFRRALGTRLILYGEWCWALHTVAYAALPDWFLAYDVFDREAKRFFARRRRDDLARALGVHVAPLIAEGLFTEKQLAGFIGPSHLGAPLAEGIYLRWDEGDWLVARAKVVRRGWLSTADEHWTKRRVVPNRIAADVTVDRN